MDAMEDMDLLSGSSSQLNKPNGVSEVGGAGVSGNGASLADSAKNMANLQYQTSLSNGIKYRHIGKTGMKVSTLGLGSMKLFTQDNMDVAENIVTMAYENGINFFDVSDPHNQTRSEVAFGRIFAQKRWNRKSFNICTRVNWSK